jgi:4-hydroxy-3-polyprenylbenzoate decarboxylase
MGYRSLRECIDDLDRHGQLVRIEDEVDPDLEAAEIQRRVSRSGGPAVYYARAKGTRFPLVSNLFGTIERARFLFRDTLDAVTRLVELRADPTVLMRSPWRYLGAPWTALHMLPWRTTGGPVFAHAARVSDLPRVRAWPKDGGTFVTLPQVYTEHPEHSGWRGSNLGMYRIQLSGGQYRADAEVGLHYQIHRGIGVHHEAAVRRGERLRVSVWVGGPPACSVAAVMPLPEGLSEVTFAGALGGRRVRLARAPGATTDVFSVNADADFCLTGTVEPGHLLPEGPFGDHLGYYSLAHPFPVLRVEHVWHREEAIWPFTVVGRPPQEDTSFGKLVHELTGPVIPAVLPGVRAVHAVDASGVHPLLLALGSERYVPFAAKRRPQELLTQANAILGQGQMSLAKYLFIADHADAPDLDVHDVQAFLSHVLARFDPKRDLHFQTETTIDTLDYSGTGLNEGSKLVVAAVGPALRRLPDTVPPALRLPAGFADPRVAFRGALVVKGPPCSAAPAGEERAVERMAAALGPEHAIQAFPLVVVCDDAEFTARTFDNFVWVTFTRSNPAVDVHGAGAFVRDKHWGCTGAVVIDARQKPHHAPPLVEDPEVTRRVDRLFARGGPLSGIE